MRNLRRPQLENEACEYLVELIKIVAQSIGNDELYGEAQLQADTGCDSTVLLKNVFRNGGVYDTGFAITPILETKAKGLGKGQQKYIRYYITHEVFIPGVRYYPDGSGEPDSSDTVDDFDTDSPTEAVKQGVLLALGSVIEHTYDCLGEQDMMADEAEFEKEQDELAEQLIDLG